MLPSGWALWDSITTASGPEPSDAPPLSAPAPPALMVRRLTLAAVVAAGPALGMPLDVPGNAVLQREEALPLGSVDMAVGPFADGALPGLAAEGAVLRQAWQIDAAGLSTLQILAPLRDQLTAGGYRILFTCATAQCGGFDFRFALDVMPAPEMFVDLGDFRYLAARNDSADGPAFVSLLVSRTALAGYLQIIRVGPPGGDVPLTTVTQAPVRADGPLGPLPPPGDFAARIEVDGRVILSDLTFEVGSAQLGPGPYASLQALADYLGANPSRAVALVGHTDSQGALDANIALSKRRAGSVLERLVSDHDIPRRQLAAEGMGFLAPLASNLTADGRDLNRRVEVIITSVE